MKEKYSGNKPNITKEQIGKLAKQNKLDQRWWSVDKDELAESVQATVKAIDKTKQQDIINELKYARLYSNQEMLGYLGFNYSASRTQRAFNKQSQLTYNVVRSAIDTAQSKIAKSKPRVQFLTEDGNFSLQERAKKLSKYVEGIFYEEDVYEKAQSVFIAACVFGTGALKVFHMDGKLHVENVYIQEIKVDNLEGMYGKPRQMHQTKQVSKDLLMAQYPEHMEAILNASSDSNAHTSIDMVDVTESWHLPSNSESNDGRHCITIESCVLFDEQYEKDYFPFVFFKWSDKLAGFYGQGLAEQLLGIQVEINKILRNIQKAIHLVAVPRVGIDQASKVSRDLINNEIGMIFKYAGNPPSFFTPQAMNSEVYNHLKWLIQSAYELTGISQLSATGKKPAGLDAAVALREYQDIETERFMITAQKYENLFLNLAEIVIDISRDMYKENNNLEVKTQSSKFIETIKWKEVDLDDSKFVMKMFPVSLLPSTPSGRLQKVQEMLQAGLIGQEHAIQLLDFPDLEKIESLEQSSIKLADKQLASIIEKGKYMSPEPQQGLEMTLKLAQQSYLKHRIENLPEDRLELILRYIDDTERLIKQQQQAEVPAELAEQPMPEAAPGEPISPIVAEPGKAPSSSPMVAEPGKMPTVGNSIT